MKTFIIRLVLLCAAVGFLHTASRPQNPDKDRLSPAGVRLVDSLLRIMTLPEKIGQLTLLTSDWEATGPVLKADYKTLIAEGKVGAIFNAYTTAYVRSLQKLAVEGTRLGIPLMFGYDVIHGHRTIFPIPLAQACSWDLAAIEQGERIAASEATAEGLNWTFAPMVDLARDPRWGRVSEGAGEDTWLGCRIAEARVKGFQGTDPASPNTLLACVKHFAAYGAPQGGRDYNTVDMSMVSLLEWYLPPYRAAIDAGAGSVMTSFNEIAGVPSTSSKWLLTELLRDEWGFRGFVVTDYTSINELIPHGVAGDLREAAQLAVNAGVDMDMQGNAFLQSLESLVNDRKVSVERLDQAVRVILEAKYKLGLFEDPYRYCNEQRESKELMTPGNLDAARKLASASCVLLKNENNTLPIPGTVKKIAIIGPLGDSKKDMLGNWSAAGRWEDCVTLVEGVRNYSGDRFSVYYEEGCKTTDTATGGFGAAIELAQRCDFVILALGENGWMSGEASSRTGIGLPGSQDNLAQAIIKTGKPVAVVLFNGRPLAITALDRMAPAILESWFGGTQAGNGIADILFGKVNPCGKLTMSFPRSEGQIPVFYNTKNTGRPYDPSDPSAKYVSRYIDSPNDPLYPFGYGLSYTTFEYSGIKADVKDDEITVKVRITNTGQADGTEVAQLYIHDKVASVTRPVRELKGFQKVRIVKGETVEVVFKLTRDDLAFIHPDLKRYWEPGVFEAFVGTSSNATLSTTFILE